MLDDQLDRDIATVTSFVYDTPCKEVFDRIKAAMSEAPKTPTNTGSPKLPPCGCHGAVAKAGLIHEGCNYCPKCGRQLRAGA